MLWSIWSASSRVGVKTNIRTGCIAGEVEWVANRFKRSKLGNINAAVLPVPVCAAASKSCPAKALGMAAI